MTHEPEPNQICLLWHAVDQQPGEPLIRALSKRGLAVMPATSIHTIFAVACRCAKSAKRVVIVFDDRASLAGVDRVLDGLDRFAPSVICWEHCQGENPPMVPVVRETPTIPSTGPSEPASKPASASEPGAAAERTTISIQSDAKLRLVGEDEALPQSPTASLPSSFSPKGPISARDVLDADELDALLAGELGEDQARE